MACFECPQVSSSTPMQVYINLDPCDHHMAPFSKDRERRVRFNDQFLELYNLIPNPKKKDRASVIKEVTNYIKKLSKKIEEFKILVEKKRIAKKLKSKNKNKAIANGEEEEGDTLIYIPYSETDQSCFNNSLRCYLLKRKTKFNEVDVGITSSCLTMLRFVKDLVWMQVKFQTQRLKMWRDSTWKWFKLTHGY
ncbi:unnamed protein product [Cochlearia groenlandica]